MAASEESFLDLGTNLEDVPEVSSQPEAEYQIRIIDLGITESEKGKFLMPRFEIVGVSNAKEFNHPLRIPDPKTMDEKELNRRKRAIKHFYKAFGIPTEGPVVFNEQIGKTGYALLGESEDKKYGKQNNIRSFSVPK